MHCLREKGSNPHTHCGGVQFRAKDFYLCIQAVVEFGVGAQSLSLN
jgi:hypothetical protein